jgi:hypothetical protein
LINEELQYGFDPASSLRSLNATRCAHRVRLRFAPAGRLVGGRIRSSVKKRLVVASAPPVEKNSWSRPLLVLRPVEEEVKRGRECRARPTPTNPNTHFKQEISMIPFHAFSRSYVGHLKTWYE